MRWRAQRRATENYMDISGIISAIIVGAIIGGLGRLVIRGKQNISLLMTVVIGIVTALLGTFLAVRLGVGTWIEFFIQVALAAVGVSLYTGGGRSRGRSRRR
jgi:uncharacterized membrane protein YeaQ/YmgE (transglycosylase-associated protein family)